MKNINYYHILHNVYGLKVKVSRYFYFNSFLTGSQLQKKHTKLLIKLRNLQKKYKKKKKKKKNIFFHSQKKRKCSLFVYYESFHVYYILSCIKYKNIMDFMEF